MKLPVMVGFGGINPAGRMSFDHAYRRLVVDALDQDKQDSTYDSLARLMQLEEDPTRVIREYARNELGVEVEKPMYLSPRPADLSEEQLDEAAAGERVLQSAPKTFCEVV